MLALQVDRGGEEIDDDHDGNSDFFCIFQERSDTVEAVNCVLKEKAALIQTTSTHMATADTPRLKMFGKKRLKISKSKQPPGVLKSRPRCLRTAAKGFRYDKHPRTEQCRSTSSRITCPQIIFIQLSDISYTFKKKTFFDNMGYNFL